MANLIEHDPIPRSPHRTLSVVRSRIDGYHFSKEALSAGERDILDLAEDLLSVVDDQLAKAKKAEDEAAAAGLSEAVAYLRSWVPNAMAFGVELDDQDRIEEVVSIRPGYVDQEWAPEEIDDKILRKLIAGTVWMLRGHPRRPGARMVYPAHPAKVRYLMRYYGIQAPTDGDEVLGFELPPARTKENR